MIVLRVAGPSDVAGLAALAAVTFPLACPPTTTDEAKADFIARHLSEPSFEAYLADPARTILVAGDEELFGYVMLVVEDPADADVGAAITTRPTAELSKCYVRPEAHGSGVAAELMVASVGEARERGVAAVWLGVNQHNARANRFYAKHGFVRVGTRRFLVGQVYEEDFIRERVL